MSNRAAFAHQRPSRPARHPRLTLRPQAPAGERGFTLIEVIVAIAILGVIIVPLSTTLVTSFKVTGNVKKNLSASIARDTLASQFSNDVAAVDAAGVSNVESLSCKPSTAPLPTPKFFLVSFSSSKLTSTGTTVVKRVSYFQTGTGYKATIVRTECPNATSLTTGKSAVVADSIGTDGQTGQQVFGWFDPPPGGGAADRPACDEFKCGLDLPYAQPRTIGVTAQRRVFGAGVPQEAGRIISSSKSTNSSTGIAYKQYDTSNVMMAQELELANQELTLPPGLDPSPSLTVSYAIKQVETGKWLTGRWAA
ncbi:prepilin-type N-terminal cleavage/methylation domain-containing protein [Aquihabitans daechungensis]|uniref:type IV pilus modification PilV family protein n=1 Tax=Aquihabitans daechungensis TaxID=1052257 RepID=UPI003B9E3D0F